MDACDRFRNLLKSPDLRMKGVCPVKLKRMSALCLLCCLLLSTLCSCRSSPVLEEVLYTYEAPVVEEEEEMLDPEDEGEEDEDFQEEEEEEAETERDTEEDEGIYDEEPEVPEEELAADSTEVELNAASDEDLQSDQTTEQTAQTENTGTGQTEEAPVAEITAPAAEPEPEVIEETEPESEPAAEETEETAPAEDAEVETETEATVETEPEPAAEEELVEETSKQVVDASGAIVTLPENVETVTAVGAAAQMVEMLGGSGRLLGTNADLLDSSLAQLAFSDYASIQSWWTGDGSSAISENSFAELLAAAPDVCFEISGQNTFTDAQVQQLNDAGIAYVILPALSSQANLEQAVSLVAQVLGTSSDGEDCTSIASSYTAWVEQVVSEVGSLTSDTDLTSLYIVDWDENASWTLSDTPDEIPVSGTGLAMAYSPAKSQLVSTFMNAAGIVNESTRTNTHKDSSYVYVSPMFHQFNPVVSGSRAAYYSGGGDYASAYDLFVARLRNQVYYQLGGEAFPAVIVASEEIKSTIEENWFWQYHESSEDGFIYLDSGAKVYRAITGEYEIYVNPTGMVSWAEGSVESPLEAWWVACKLAGVCDMDRVKSETSEFYETFFGVALSAADLEDIFGE